MFITAIQKEKADPGKIRLEFFPEGGNLINGLQTNLVIKSIGQNGLPVNISGDIVDSKKNSVSKFSTGVKGLSLVTFTPVKGESYSAVSSLSNGGSKVFALPATSNEGISLAVTNTHPTKTFLRVERGKENPGLYNELFVAATLHDQLVYIGKFNVEEGLDAASVNKKNLPPGVLHVFVMDKNGKLLAQRLVFINNPGITLNAIKPKQLDRDKRKRNELNLSLPPNNNAEISASVVNAETSSTGQSRENIMSAMLLTSELNGYVHEPAYYFQDTTAARMQELDMLMLTSRPGRFDYSKVFIQQFPKLLYPVESGISISGMAIKPGTNTPIKSGRVNLWIKGEDSTSILAEAQTNEQGRFLIPSVEYRSSAKILYQGTSLKKESALVEVKIFPSFYDTLKTPHGRPVIDLNPYLTQNNDEAKIADEIVNKITASQSANTKLLQEIKVSGRKRSLTDSLNQVYASDAFLLSDQTFAPDSNRNYADIWQLLRSRISGLSINKTDTGTEVTFSRYNNLNLFGESSNASVQFFLNEVPVTIDIIEFINPNDVALVKSYSGNTGIALGATRGAISIYTIKGKGARDWRTKGFDAVDKPGYSLQNYEGKFAFGSTPPENAEDYRTTLFWNPFLRNNAAIIFYNDDHSTKYRVVIEGIDRDGKLFFSEGYF